MQESPFFRAVLRDKALYSMISGALILIGLAIVLLLVSNHAEAGDFGVNIQYNIPSSGIANVTPGVDYQYTVNITNTGTNSTGEDINLTVELDAASVAAGWTVTPSGTILVSGMGPGNTTGENVTVRAPSGARFEDTAIVNVSVEVIGHEGEVGSKDSLQLRANVLQTFDVLVTTPQDTKTADPGENVSFEIKVTNKGNGNDTFVFSDVGDELGIWSVPDVTLAPDEYAFIYYNVSVASGHNTSDITVALNITSNGDVSGLTFGTLGIIIHVNPIYGLHADITPSLLQNVDIGSNVTFNFTVHNLGTTAQHYTVTTMSYDSANLAAPVYNSSIMPFPSSPTTNDVPLEMTVQPTADALNDSYVIWVRIVVQQDTAVQYHVNLTVNVLPRYGVEISAQNNETNVTIPINTYGNYTLIIKNTGNSEDTFHLGAIEPYSMLVSFDPVAVALPSGQSAFVTCRVYTDQTIVEINNLYQSGIPSTIRVTSENDTNEFAAVTLDTDITVTHAHLLRSPDSEKDAEPGDTADFLLYIDNTGTTGDKYVASVVAFNTSALDNPTFDLVNPFPSSQVAAGTSTTLHVFVDVLDQTPSVPIGAYNITIRISIDGFPAVYKDFTYLVNVKQVYSHTLEAVDDSKEADVDEYVDYTVSVKNTGNGPETFIIRATGDYSSLVTFSRTEVVLNQSESVDIDVQVFTDQMIIDREELYGTDMITPIEVVSKNDPDSFSVEIPIYTRIKVSYAFEFTSPQTTKQGQPGDSVQFTLQIRNTGTATDSYDFMVTSIDEDIFTIDGISPINDLGV
ncbi:MAG: hypothetical protein JSW28_06955, partial [Thermoplasmata archaeon]